jgi:putative thiamine transport system ATP-binding protein
MSPNSLVLDDVALAVGRHHLLGPLSLTAGSGEIVTVMGPSGCGKSSLLAYICGTLDRALTGTGRVLLNGRDVTALPIEVRRIGILFQDDLLFPHMTVGENLAFGLAPEVRGVDRVVAVRAALADVDLDGFADRDPMTLSGGQRARVALMRVLLSAPQALLLDEPFSRLDTAMRTQTRALVFAMIKQRRVPTLLVTHDDEDARAAGGPVTLLGER